MIQYLSTFRKSLLQITLYFFINGLFILKYLSRTNTNTLVFLCCYIIFTGFFILIYNKATKNISEKSFKIAFWTLLLLMTLVIAGLLIHINPYSVRVDRWSAVSFFLDYLFQGKYPYAAHTHVSITNFASPFPIWHIINIPFYLLGDVGIGLIFFLLLTAISIVYFFDSYKSSLFFLLLLFMAPAYWWEIAVRSDSLSNALLVFTFILWFRKKRYSLSSNFWLAVLVCGLISSTRLSAILPLALFFFKPFWQLGWKKRVGFLSATLGITIISFIPFIFWDTTNWIFFSRNPFMSQGSVGNPFLLIVMIILGCILAYRWENNIQLFNITSIFIFVFILSSQISLIITRGINGNIFTDSLYDISYFNLALPYVLAYIASSVTADKTV